MKLISRVEEQPGITALVPMKGHSERVPNKNLLPFCGRPLFYWVLKSLQNSAYIARIVVNTDSNDIAQNVLRYFASVHVINRPETICGDFVSMNTIIAYDLSQIEGEHFLQTHSTNPLLTTEMIDRAIECYFKFLGTNDSLFSVTRLQTRLYWHNGQSINHDPQEMLRTQDLLPVYQENSNLYIFS